MKKLLASIIFLLFFTAVSFAQTKDTSNTTVKNENIKKEVATAYTFKAEVIKLNRKKNLEIISIKSYRRSLNIKVKTIKMC